MTIPVENTLYYERQAPVVQAVQYHTGMTPLPDGVVLDEHGHAVLPMGETETQPVEDTDWVVTDVYTGAQTIMIDDYFSRAFAPYHGPLTDGRPVRVGGL